MGLNNSKNRALYQAVKTNNYNECKRLIENGADVNYYTDYYGSFPLMAATLNDNADICKLLLNNGADVNQKYSFGRTNTCIELAKDHNVIKILLDAGATIHDSFWNFEKLECIIYGNFEEIFRIMLDNDKINKNYWMFHFHKTIFEVAYQIAAKYNNINFIDIIYRYEAYNRRKNITFFI
jgi:ankyrin repeat protein